MEGHEPDFEITDGSNNTADPDVAAEGVGTTADNSSVPERSDHSKEADGVNIVDGTGTKDDNENGERDMPGGGVKDMPGGGVKGDITAEPHVGASDVAVGDAPKKKRKGKSKSQKAAKSGTGFEEYYVDAPLKPEEHEEEIGLYHVSLPFAQRIEFAIQRYVLKRNMDATRKNILDKYLASGGVDSGPKMFSGGTDSKTLETGDAKDIALLTATNFVDLDKTDPQNEIYVVDFEGCLRSFLSYTVPLAFDLTSEERVKSITNVIRNFLNYLLYHNVCPEYEEQIKSSKKLCDQGERELWAISQNALDFPGTFNKACSELYGGLYQGQWAATEPWRLEEESNVVSYGISPAHARQVFKLGIVANTSEEQFEEYEVQNSTKSISIKNVEEVSMEVVKTIPSDEDAQSVFAIREDLIPVGRLITKTWPHPFPQAEDLTEEEEIARANEPKETKTYEFWVEDNILRNCFPGMKLDVTVTELSFGLCYFDRVHNIYCSFFDITPNAEMADWKEPEGAGNWLPMRETEDEDGEEGLDSSDVDENVPKDAENGTKNAKKDTKKATNGNEEAKEGTQKAVEHDANADKA